MKNVVLFFFVAGLTYGVGLSVFLTVAFVLCVLGVRV